MVVTCMQMEGQGVEARAPLSLFLAVMVFLSSPYLVAYIIASSAMNSEPLSKIIFDTKRTTMKYFQVSYLLGSFTLKM